MRTWTIRTAPSRTPRARRSATSWVRAIAGAAIGAQASRLAGRDQRAETPGSRAPVARAPPLLVRLVGAERDAGEDRHAAEQLVRAHGLVEADPADRHADQRLEVQERSRRVGGHERLPEGEEPERQHRAGERQG